MTRPPRKKRSLGQHFLRDTSMIQKIVNALPADPEDRVVEIGPGDGALTKLLIRRFSDLLAIEIDPVMIAHLREILPALKIHHSDFLKQPMDTLASDKPVHVIGNLPYYVTSPILFRILEYRHLFETATLMMQKEVAKRIVSPPDCKEYGILSVQVQLMAEAEYLFDVPPSVFSPPPAVDSAVLRLRFCRPALRCTDEHLKLLVRTAFNKRRKMLSNAFKDLPFDLPDQKELRHAGFDLSLRAGAWSPAMYEKLAEYLEKHDIMKS